MTTFHHMWRLLTTTGELSSSSLQLKFSLLVACIIFHIRDTIIKLSVLPKTFKLNIFSTGPMLRFLTTDRCFGIFIGRNSVPLRYLPVERLTESPRYTVQYMYVYVGLHGSTAILLFTWRNKVHSFSRSGMLFWAECAKGRDCGPPLFYLTR